MEKAQKPLVQLQQMPAEATAAAQTPRTIDPPSGRAAPRPSP